MSVKPSFVPSARLLKCDTECGLRAPDFLQAGGIGQIDDAVGHGLRDKQFFYIGQCWCSRCGRRIKGKKRVGASTAVNLCGGGEGSGLGIDGVITCGGLEGWISLRWVTPDQQP